MEVPLRGIIFSEFHPTAGPKITFMAPENCMEKEVFDTVSSYIIPKPELKDRLITITTLDYKILGCPVCIQDKKYERNALIFNLCFVCTAQSRTKPIEPVVKKLADYLTTLETESDFVSNENKKMQIQPLIEQILRDLNETRRCSITVNDSVTIYLKVIDRLPLGDSAKMLFGWEQVPPPSCPVSFPPSQYAKEAPDTEEPMLSSDPFVSSSALPLVVREHDVPIFKAELAAMSRGGSGGVSGVGIGLSVDEDEFVKIKSHLDMTTQQILPFIDGFRHVKRISLEADVDINLVKICLQNLLQFGYILIIPIFLYSNVYVATEDLDRLVSEKALWDQCRHFVKKRTTEGRKESSTVRPKTSPLFLSHESVDLLPSFTDVFTILCGMNMGTRIKDLCNRHARHFSRIDVKRLVQFGLIHKLIYCVRKYPVVVNSDCLSKRLRPLARLLNGERSLDEIACRAGFDFQELEELVEEDPGVVTVIR